MNVNSLCKKKLASFSFSWRLVINFNKKKNQHKKVNWTKFRKLVMISFEYLLLYSKRCTVTIIIMIKKLFFKVILFMT